MKALKLKTLENIFAYIFLLPALVLLSIWVLLPLLQTFWYSLLHIDLLRFSQKSFVGIKNYIELFRDFEFNRSVKVSIIFVSIVVPIQCVLALIVSVLLEKVSHKSKSFCRTVYFIPYIISPVAITIIFMKLFTKDGLLSKFFSWFGIPNTTWYTNLDLALLFLAFIYIWMSLGFYIVLFSVGLNTIPLELYDAAKVDGANSFQTFFYVVLPVLKPFIFLVLSTSIISAFQVFDQAYVLARGASLGSPAGATMTLPVFIYAQAFRYNNISYGASAAIVLLMLVLIITILLRTRFREEKA